MPNNNNYMLETYFKSLVASLENKLKEKKTGKRMLLYEMGKLGEKLFDNNYAVGWTTVFVPFEIFQSMDVIAFFVEFVGAMLANTGFATNFLQRGEQEGYSTDGCSYHRCVIGAAKEEILPKPDVLVGATTPCDGGLNTIVGLGHLYNKDVFTLQIPLEYSKESVQYLVAQYKEMINFIKEKTKKNFDIDKLRERIKFENENTQLIKKVFELGKKIPSPITGNDLKNFAIIFALIGSSSAGVKVAKQYLDDLETKVQEGISGLPEEKYRLLWIQNRIQFKNNIVDNLEKNFGANIVIDELNHIYWDYLDESYPLETLAKRQILHPFNGNLKRRVEILKQQAKEYKVDGAVLPSHWGCRQSCAGRKIFKDALNEVGVPMISLDVDCIDERNFSEGQFMTRLEGFLEMLK